MSETLAVWTSGLKTGLLQRSDQYVFNYEQEVPDSGAVSLTMPVRLQSWTHRALHPVFQMNLPEGALLEAIRKAVAKLVRTDDLTLLRIVGTNQIGRNRFSLPGDLSPVQATQPESLLDILRYPDTRPLFEELLHKYALSSGVSGMQPKVLLESRERATIHSDFWIMKSSGDDYPFLGVNEYFCMSAARAAGLPVPDFHVSEDGRLFVLKRFDRDERTFLGFEDFCSLQGLGTEEKYSGSYERAVKTINQFVSPAYRLRAREQFFKTLALSVMVRNGDAHLKNFGVLYSDPTKDRKLAPAYDIVTTTAYIRNDIPALTLEGTKKWWDTKTLARFGKTVCGLSVSTVSQGLEQVRDAVSGVRPKLQRYVRRHPEFKVVGENMIRAWDQGLTERI
jgi:serine/threonine-protein kinase HipA